jgi:hypothetical protein
MKILVLLIPLLLGGCALSVASSKELSENRYEISASGNVWDNQETLLETINRKAVKVCDSEIYTVYGDSPIIVGSVETGYATAPTQTLIRTVVCESN